MKLNYHAALLLICLVLFEVGALAQGQESLPPPITDDTIDASQINSEVELPPTPEPAPPASDKKSKKKSKKKKGPSDSQPKVSYRHASALELGLGTNGAASVAGGHDVKFENALAYGFGFVTKTSFLMGLVKVPFLEAIIRLQYIPSSGQTDYNYTGDSGIQYSKVAAPFKMTTYKADFGYRINPMYLQKFQPFIEFGFDFGYHTIKFGDAISTDLFLQGSDYRLEHDFGSYGYYGKVGAVAYTTQHAGFFAEYGIDYQAAYSARLFGKMMLLKAQLLNIGFNYGF